MTDRKDLSKAYAPPDGQAIHFSFYRAFEERFRGPRETILSRFRVYLPFAEPLTSVYGRPAAVDIGCGRGEWLELLGENGFDAHGVDLDDGMLAACYERGLRATKEKGIAFLEKLPNESQAIVSGFHIAEHLPFARLQTFVHQALRVLNPGGLLILETPNLENFRVSSLMFYYDPTHPHPLPSESLSFLLTEYYGFNRGKLVRQQECAGLSTSQSSSLGQVLGGASADYAVIAQKAADGAVIRLFDNAFNKEFGLDAHVLVRRFDRELTAQNQGRAAPATRLDEESAAWPALEVNVLAKNETIAALYSSKSWRIPAPLRSTCHAARWFLRGAWAWVKLEPGSGRGASQHAASSGLHVFVVRGPL
jgi:SAM-dependent methyltransferase